ncbi:hypothetical protein PSHT_02390 [Puccinia striiformis]|uniref:Uncharacterized protein n=1 Tax=Puccinia striiformis TaxID=27350 RepID=A0A2S4WID8_9BASI|nr:hypothetical protein PSHT_02390 [Puccinia striiformis]
MSSRRPTPLLRPSSAVVSRDGIGLFVKGASIANSHTTREWINRAKPLPRKKEMLVHQIICLTVTSLLHACSAYDTSDPNIKCVPRVQTGRANCKTSRGLLTLQFHVHESVPTAKFSTNPIRLLMCPRWVLKRSRITALTKQAIEAGFDKMLSHCKEHVGAPPFVTSSFTYQGLENSRMNSFS